MKKFGSSRILPTAVLLAGWLFLASSSRALDESAKNATGDPGIYLKVRLSEPIKLSKLKAGDVIQGALARDAYSADRKLFPAGSPVKLTVDHLEKRKRTANDHWPWVIKAFTPRRESYPVFKTVAVITDQGEDTLDANLISISRLREVHAQTKKGKPTSASPAVPGSVELSHSNTKKIPVLTAILEASEKTHRESTGGYENGEDAFVPHTVTLPAGTRCKILLLNSVSASKSKVGDRVEARLLEPVILDSQIVLPAGSLVQGKVVRKTPPRLLSRPGSLYLIFNEITLPEGQRLPIAASLAGAELDGKSHTRIDREGKLHGERPGAAWMAINLGVSAGLAKEVDDSVQLVIEAIISTATDASTAGTARIASSCISGLYMATRHGRDVVLPRFTEMDISLDRAASVGPASAERLAVISISGGK